MIFLDRANKLVYGLIKYESVIGDIRWAVERRGIKGKEVRDNLQIC